LQEVHNSTSIFPIVEAAISDIPTFGGYPADWLGRSGRPFPPFWLFWQTIVERIVDFKGNLFPMAGYLASKGRHEVTVYNRTPSKGREWLKKFSGRVAATAAEAAAGQDFVMACVGNDDDLTRRDDRN
jgi:NAD binding domain of 6-phosphogluconate dehydrogenase